MRRMPRRISVCSLIWRFNSFSSSRRSIRTVIPARCQFSIFGPGNFQSASLCRIYLPFFRARLAAWEMQRRLDFSRRLSIKQILRCAAQDDRKQRGHFTPNVASFFSNLHSSGTLARLMQISDLPARDRWSRRCRRDRRSPHSRRACLSPASGAKCARD